MDKPPYFEGAIRNIIKLVPGKKYTKHYTGNNYTGNNHFTEDIEILSRPFWNDIDFWVITLFK
jgi:hypothetical protein